MARFFLSQTQIEGDTVNVEGADAIISRVFCVCGLVKR